jgi:diguanylate cyclase (GGDEF)-like protein
MARRSTDLVARYGGEEFVIVLPDCDAVEAVALADEVRERVSRLALSNPKSSTGHITLSIGVASCLPEQGISTQQLFETADTNLYQAKHDGRNRVYMATPSGAHE